MKYKIVKVLFDSVIVDCEGRTFSIDKDWLWEDGDLSTVALLYIEKELQK